MKKLNSSSYKIEGTKKRLKEVQVRVNSALLAAGRKPGETSILAVSKKKPVAAIESLYKMGQIDFGENVIQEASRKVSALKHLNINWHFIGQIQSNKTREIAENFQWVHTVDRIKIAKRLNNQRPHQAPPLQICIQVNQKGESQKGGIEPSGVKSLAYEIMELPRLHLRGLMTIPPLAKAPEETATFFSLLEEQLNRLKEEGIPMDTLSMGMSSDLETAILNNSTIVRIGKAIFGPRLQNEKYI